VRFVFGCEEALGYTAGTLVRDKDGIASAVLAARLAAQLKREGRTLFDLLETLHRRHGVWLSGQVTLRAASAEQQQLMARARAAPPQALAGRLLRAVHDLLAGTHTGEPSQRLDLPPSDALIWELDGGDRIAIRPSGTEPKLKLYLDVREPVAEHQPVAAAQTRAETALAELSAALRAYAAEA
jgi:phosphomannomutase